MYNIKLKCANSNLTANLQTFCLNKAFYLFFFANRLIIEKKIVILQSNLYQDTFFI